MKSIYVILFGLAFNLYSFESSESFQIKVYDSSIKVIAPSAFDKKLYAVIENQTLSKLVGKIVTDKDRLVATVAIESQGSKSIDLKATSGERFFFIPLAPPFQEVELIVGKKVYEIPPRR